jgi:hypothetical protein
VEKVAKTQLGLGRYTEPKNTVALMMCWQVKALLQRGVVGVDSMLPLVGEQSGLQQVVGRYAGGEMVHVEPRSEQPVPSHRLKHIWKMVDIIT